MSLGVYLSVWVCVCVFACERYPFDQRLCEVLKLPDLESLQKLLRALPQWRRRYLA